VARKNRGGDRVAKDEDRKHPEEGLRAGSSRSEQDRRDHEPIRVPKKREEAHVERIPAEEGKVPEEVEVRDDEVLIPVIEEEVVMEKRPVVKEVLRVSKDVVEDEEAVSVDIHEKDKDKHRYLNERAQRGQSESDRRAATGREEDRGRGDTSFIDKAKDALSGEDTQEREGTRARRDAPRGPRGDEPPRRTRR
jgi:uncharacterized protein (TIGR02271 family)